MSEKELVDNLIMLLSAGCEPTVNLLANAVVLLLREPGQLELVRSGRASWGTWWRRRCGWRRRGRMRFCGMRWRTCGWERR